MREIVLGSLFMVLTLGCSCGAQQAQECQDCVKDTGVPQATDVGVGRGSGDTGDVGEPDDAGDASDFPDGGLEHQIAVRPLGAACGDWIRRPVNPVQSCPSRPLTVEWVLSFEPIDVPYVVRIGDSFLGNSAANMNGEVCFTGSPFPSQPGCISQDGATTWKASIDNPETSVIGGPAVAPDGAMYWLLGDGLLARRDIGAQGMEQVVGLWDSTTNLNGDAKLTVGPGGVLAAIGRTSTGQPGVIAVSRCGAKVWEVDGATDILFADATGFWIVTQRKIITVSSDGKVTFTLDSSDGYVSAMPLSGGSVAFSSCDQVSKSTRCEVTLSGMGFWPEGTREEFRSFPRRTGRDSLVLGWGPSEGVPVGGVLEVLSSSGHVNIGLLGGYAGEPVVTEDGSILIARTLPNGSGPRGVKTVLYDFAADGHENGQIALDDFATDQEPLLTHDGRIYLAGTFVLSDGARVYYKDVVLAIASGHCGATGSFWTRTSGNMFASRFSE